MSNISHLIRFADSFKLSPEQHDALIAKVRQFPCPRKTKKRSYPYRSMLIAENNNSDMRFGAIEIRLYRWEEDYAKKNRRRPIMKTWIQHRKSGKWIPLSTISYCGHTGLERGARGAKAFADYVDLLV